MTAHSGRAARLARIAPPLALVFASGAGLALFAWPFLGSGNPGETTSGVVVAATIVALLAIEVGARRLDSRDLALLACLAALDAAARAVLVEGIGGFSPIFFLVLCGGYVLGAEFGFLLGAMSLLVSALVTGGLGPWLPYELFGVAWVGALAGVAGSRRSGRPSWRDLAVLATVAVVTGYAYGALEDLWQWTMYAAAPGLGYRPGMGVGTALDHFGRFYVASSLGWDSFRAWGDALVVVAIGLPVMAGLRRLRGREHFELVLAPGAPLTAGAPVSQSPAGGIP